MTASNNNAPFAQGIWVILVHTEAELGNGRLFRAALRENFGCWFRRRRRKIFEELSMPKANLKKQQWTICNELFFSIHLSLICCCNDVTKRQIFQGCIPLSSYYVKMSLLASLSRASAAAAAIQQREKLKFDNSNRARKRDIMWTKYIIMSFFSNIT